VCARSASRSPGSILDAADLAAALIFTVAVLRSRALRPLTPQLMDFGADDEDFGADNIGFGEDA
jgi:hypothetical protein